VHVHNTFPLISPAVYRAATRRAIPVVQTVQNYRMVCAAASLLRDGALCSECIGPRLPLAAVRHACYHDSRVESGVVAAMQVTHRRAGTWGNDVSLFLPVSDHVLRRLVDAGAFDASRAMVRRNHIYDDPGARSVGSDRGYVAFAGRLSVEKGAAVLVKAASLVPDVAVRIVGDGPQRAELERMVEALGATNVAFLGHLPRAEVMEVVRGARCLAFTSIWEEPMGIVLIEAAALGVPVIGTSIGGAPECIGPGSGALVAPGDVNALAEQLRAAASDPYGWWERGQAARRHFEQEFSAERSYQTLARAYDRVGVDLGP
jgi:glycosyltransferase involved in cell wall biosynthesis